jgi:hypothetical protein
VDKRLEGFTKEALVPLAALTPYLIGGGISGLASAAFAPKGDRLSSGLVGGALGMIPGGAVLRPARALLKVY